MIHVTRFGITIRTRARSSPEEQKIYDYLDSGIPAKYPQWY